MSTVLDDRDFLESERQTWGQARALIRSDFDRLAAHLKQEESWSRRAYFFLLPGFQALLWYRLSRYLYLRGWRNTARLLSLFSLYLTRAELPPTTSIGPAALIAHGTCVNVFGRIGARVTMNGSCGFGGGFGVKDIGGGPGYPVVGDDVVLAYGAQVMGAVRIGDGAHIGPGALVTFDVADGALVLWDRPRVIEGGASETRPAMNRVAAAVDLSVVIVNWNVRELLRGCLASVFAAGGLDAATLQVIVVDNASVDGSAAMVREAFPQVELIANRENLGFGGANNQALGRCTGRHLLLLNPDTRVHAGALAALLGQMDAQPDVAVIGCRLLNADGTLQRWTGGAYPRLLNVVNHYFFLDRLVPGAWRPPPMYLDRDVQHDVDVDWVSGAVMLLRGDRLGGRLFDPNYFMYGEDMELCHRLKLAGGRVVYTPRVSITHYQGESMKQQQGDVLLSSLKGPRQFYRQMRGDRAVRVYDAVTVAGFALRWLLFRIAGAVRPALRPKARSSQDMMRRAWRILRA